MDVPVCTLADLSKLIQSKPKIALIKASPESKEIFSTLGKLGGFKSTRLNRFLCNGAISIDGDMVVLGVRAGRGMCVQRLDIVYSGGE